MSSKMTLAQLREQHHFDIVELATRAVVDTTDVLRALRGDAISRATATAILTALSRELRREYTFDNVEITLKDPSL